MFQYEKSLKSTGINMDPTNKQNSKLSKDLLNVQEIVEKVDPISYHQKQQRFVSQSINRNNFQVGQPFLLYSIIFIYFF